MTPIEALNCAVAATEKALENGLTQGGAYQHFLIQSGERLDNAAQALTAVAMNRPHLRDRGVARFEMAAYFQILQAAISVLLALAHFPYLDRIDTKEVHEKLCLNSSTDTSKL
jgi:hypothetical protein